MTQFPYPYLDLVQQSQEAFQNAIRTWTRTVRDTVSATGVHTSPTQVDPQRTVDQVFDSAERLLATQRDFARELIQSSAALHQSVAGQGDSGDSPASAA
jgi:hypothetical protein